MLGMCERRIETVRKNLKDFEAGETGTKASREEEVIRQRGGGDSDVVCVQSHPDSGVEVRLKWISPQFRFGGVRHQGEPLDLKIGKRAHLDGDATIGHRTQQLGRVGQMQGMAEAAGVEVEDRPPDALGIVVLPGMDGQSEPAAVDRGKILAKIVCSGRGGLEAGQVHADDNRFKESATVYGQYLQKHPKGEWAYLARFGIGWAHENLKQYDEARTWYQRTIDGYDGETAARAQFQIGECYFAQGKYEDAVRELLSVASVYQYETWSAKALYEAGRALEQLKRFDEAKAVYAECVKDFAKTPEADLARKQLAALK